VNVLSTNWDQLIANNYNEIIDIGIKAYREARENSSLRYILEINNYGNVYYWYDIAGGNSFHTSTFKGDSIELISNLCFQYNELELTDEVICSKLEDYNLGHLIKELMAEAEEESTSLEVILKNHPELSKILEECMKDEIEFDISEYARDFIESHINNILKNWS
jgi:hypothetical protein